MEVSCYIISWIHILSWLEQFPSYDKASSYGYTFFNRGNVNSNSGIQQLFSSNYTEFLTAFCSIEDVICLLNGIN